MPIYDPRFRPLEAAEDDHSASRRVDVLAIEAPHLIAPDELEEQDESGGDDA